MRGEASFTHEGKLHTIKVTMDMLLRAEDETGEGMLDLMSSSRVGFIATLLRLGLAEAGGPELSRAEAAELVVLVPEARDAMRAALDAAMPAAEEEQEEPGEPKAA